MKLWRTACRRARDQFDEYVDGELEDPAWLESHLASCAACRSALEQVRSVARWLESIPRQQAPPGFAERVMAALPQGREAQAGQPASMPRRRAALAPVYGIAFATTVAAVIVTALVTFRTPPPAQPTRIATATHREPTPSAGQPAATAIEPGVSVSRPAPAAPQPSTTRRQRTPVSARRTAATMKVTQPVIEETLTAQELREAAAEYEQRGSIGEALHAYRQADEIENTASLDTARAYEMAGFAGEAIYRYAEFAFYAEPAQAD